MSIDKKISWLLNEDPDTIKFKNDKLTMDDEDAYPFIYLDDKNKLYVAGESGVGHSRLMSDVTDMFDGSTREANEKIGFYTYNFGAKQQGFHGRLWTRAKVMSFWKYPPVKEFKRIVELLNKQKFGIDNSWQIEVYAKAMDFADGKSVLIPIDKYKGQMIDIQADLDKAREIHTMKPVEKKQALKDKGYVPGYTKLKLPSKMTLAQYYNLLKKEDTEVIDLLILENKSTFQVLKDNKIALTPEERKEAMDAKCVWHMNGGSPSCAIWKAKDSSGKVWYVSNTHRAYQKAATLKGAIKKFEFVKSTS